MIVRSSFSNYERALRDKIRLEKLSVRWMEMLIALSLSGVNARNNSRMLRTLSKPDIPGWTVDRRRSNPRDIAIMANIMVKRYRVIIRSIRNYAIKTSAAMVRFDTLVMALEALRDRGSVKTRCQPERRCTVVIRLGTTFDSIEWRYSRANTRTYGNRDKI